MHRSRRRAPDRFEARKRVVADLEAAKKTFHSGYAEDVSSPAVKGWLKVHKATVTVVLNHAASFTEPNAAGAYLTRKAECDQLGSAVGAAKGLPVIPNHTAEQRWTTVLTELGDAAENCEAGIAHNDPSVFAQIPPEIMIAGDSLGEMFFGDLPSGSNNPRQSTNFNFTCSKNGSRVDVTPANGNCP